MADEDWSDQTQRIDKLQQVPPQRRELAAARRIGIAKPRWPEATQGGTENAIADAGQSLATFVQPSGQSGQPCTSTTVRRPAGFHSR